MSVNLRGSWFDRRDRNRYRNRDRKSFVNVCVSIFFFSRDIVCLGSAPCHSLLFFSFRQTLISTPYFRSFLSFHRCHSFRRFESFPTVQLLTGTLYIVYKSDRSIKHSDKKEAKPARSVCLRMKSMNVENKRFDCTIVVIVVFLDRKRWRVRRSIASKRRVAWESWYIFLLHT